MLSIPSHKRILMPVLMVVFMGIVTAASLSASAISLSDLTNKDASTGLKAALEKGSSAAVAKLGVEGGFMDNDKVKIKLPEKLDKLRVFIEMTGQSNKLERLEESMNRAAEKAVPMAKPLLINAIKSMTVMDAKNILTGGETSVTDFFRQKTTESLRVKFLPLVKNVTDKAKLAKQFNSIMSQAQQFGLAQEQESTVESYVTTRTIDGLYLMIAEEEKAIREDPFGAGSKIIGKVFGALK